MSLLMKALEKAARDRDAPPRQPEPAATRTATASSALSLLPITPSVPSASSSSTTSAAGTLRQTPENTAVPGATVAAAPGASRGSQEQQRGVSGLGAQAARATGADAVAWISTHPVPFTAALAGVFVLGYGIYIYLQAAHPSLFLRTPPAQPFAAAQPAAAVPPAPGTVPAASPLIPAPSVFSSTPGTLAPSSSAAGSDHAMASKGTVSSKAAPATAAVQRAAPTTATVSAAPALPMSRIVVSRGDGAVPRLNPAVNDAYSALEAGRFEEARRLYEQALRGEPANIDALLGLAAIAQHENRTEDAASHYLKILHIEPRHVLAQTGLIGLLGRADPQAAETRLKQLAAREPSPMLYFTLGNLYADQRQWPQAQQAYFQAHHMEPGNPDYAYNLAVALEHLGQQKIALGYYRRALQLAAGRGRANFDSSPAQARIAQLAARLE